MSESSTYSSMEGIAIIGISGRFPKAKNVGEFWQNLRDGLESVSFFSDEELESSGIAPSVLSDPQYVKAKAVLEETDLFDASLFGFSPREAEIMDPQHRLFLECAVDALENAGYNPETYEGSIGVYAGSSGINNYFLNNIYLNPDLMESVGAYQISITNDKDFLPTRVSYELNLKGPSVAVQTACSTSLVAICQACHSLLDYQCDMALAGGVSIGFPSKAGYLYQEGMILSPDGHCRAFDAKAQGTVIGNGLGIVVLKRLEDALNDGDYIHAVIKGSAINNDGSLKIGYTAPSVDGQAEVIAQALAMAKIEPDTVTYIEAHGTATPLGDPIEIAALTQAFSLHTNKKGFCAIGSVKTNMGHLDAAAGVTALIKTVLALKHKLLPPSLHFDEPNPQIDFANSPFYVNTKLSEWKSGSTPRRAGVSSFGIGGTNAHVVLEEAPIVQTSGKSRPWQLIVLSTKISSALDTATTNLLEYLKQNPDVNLADVTYTLAVGRKDFSHRRMLVCHSFDDAAIALETLDNKRVFTDYQETKDRPVAFMFSGQGAQYANMASELYQVEPTFREQVDLCCELLKPHIGLDLRHILYPNSEYLEEATQQLKQTAIAQPALFVIEYALAKLWMEWGVRPVAMIGHSIGEYVAACLAGVFSLEEALMLVVARGQLMQQLPGGAMLAVPLSVDEVQPLLGENLSLAAINGPSLCVVSGATDAVAQLEYQLVEKDVDGRRLHTSHAFHSKMIDPILGSFTLAVKKVNLKPPEIPYVSNVTGTWITAAEATDPSYWVRHLRQTVRFAEGVQVLLKEPERILLEVGPGRTLSTLAKQCREKAAQHIVLNSLQHPQDRQSDVAFLLITLGKLWQAGINVDWFGFYKHEQRHRIPLPTYPFDRQRYWIEPQKTDPVNTRQISLSKKPDIADWFYIPSWKRSTPPKLFKQADITEQKSCWLVFSDECGFSSRMVQRLEQKGLNVIAVRVGKQFARIGEGLYMLNPQQADDYKALLKELRVQGKTPKRILHLWNVTPNTYIQSEIELLEKSQDLGFFSLLFLAQAITQQNLTQPIQIGVVSNNMQQVTGVEVLCPEKATVLGPCKVIPQEYPHITCYSIDIIIPESENCYEEKLVDQILSEFNTKSSESVVAYRGNHRWVQTFESVRLEESVEGTPRLREKGVYLITGGLGGIGFVLAEYLAQTVQAKLILIGRSAFPTREEWQQWLETHDAKDELSHKIRKVLALEEVGAEVLVKSADVANHEQMQAAITQAYESFGDIHGVIHAAGIAGGGLIQLKTPETAANVLSPKVRGTRVLDGIFKDVKLDFFVLCSSLGSLVGELGQVDYCAANAFLDAFAYYSTSRYRTFTVSINWDGWQEVGMAVNTAMPLDLKEWREANLNKGILPKEGTDVFRRILCNTLPQFVVSTKDFQVTLEQSNAVTASTALEELVQARLSKSTHPRPNLQNAYVPPSNEIEQTITSIWQEVLGIDQVGIHDDFFELGGHSLLATQMISRLRGVFQVELPLNSLFEFPTVAGEADAILQHQAQHREDGHSITPLPLIVPTPEQRYVPFPLTNVQQAYWIGRSGAFELGNVATHGYLEIENVGLDVERLQLAWQRLIERHEMLRAVVLPDGQQQILQQIPEYQIEILDLRGHNLEAIASHLASIRQHMSHQVLAADQWPLFEIRASRLDDHRIRLHMSFDGLIFDAWSLGEILVQELSQLYQNPQAFLAPLEISFRDYVLAEVALRDSELYQRSRDYWFNCLSSLPSAPKLPLAKNPGSVTQPRFVRRSARLETETWIQLKNRATKAGLTPSGVLLAAFAEILTVWSKNSHFTLNITLFNRLPLHSQVNDLVGDFTSLTLLAVDNSIQEPFGVRARLLQKQLWEDLEHRCFSGVQVLRELARTEGGTTRPIMPIVFTSTLTQGTSGQEAPPLAKLGNVVYSITQTPQVWLDHQVSEEGGALVFNWDAVEELFPEGLLDDMFDAYRRFLSCLTDDDKVWQQSVLQLLPQAQLEHRAAINATGTDVSVGMLHTLFAMQVPQRLHQLAVVSSNQTLTYQQLYCRTNQVARRLRQLGVCPNMLVAVVMEKGWEQVVAVLGILQSGGAYLPIDPGLPQERLWHLLERGEVKVVLTQSWLDQNLTWPEGTQRIGIDNDDLQRVDDSPLEPVQKPDDLAYVIFTSGSTGLPKGVMIDHRGAVNTIIDINQRFSMKSRDRVLALSALNFDLSVYDIFGTLGAGGTIVIPDAQAIREPSHWAQLMVQQQVTVWNSVPALMQMLVEYAADRPEVLLNSLRLVLLSGDWLPLSLPNQIKALFEDVQVVSLGGATEASIWSILYPIKHINPAWKSIPYGKPMNNQDFHVLNEALEPSPVWVPGQLYIGGIGLAKGYWRDEEKTNASFIIHPRTRKQLYCTGDLGRYLPDGNIEFLGREDFQVKIRGYRVDLGEIEAALKQHPTVKDAVVTAVGEAQGNKQLVAYVVPDKSNILPLFEFEAFVAFPESGSPTGVFDQHVMVAQTSSSVKRFKSAELRNFLQQRLPDYMVPFVYLPLNDLPLTPNGKVNRRALPTPDLTKPELEETFVAPSTPVEEVLAGMWSEVLGLERVGIYDNFFESGGDSLLATQIISQVRENLQVELPLRSFFEAPTVAGLAASLLQEPDERLKIEKTAQLLLHLVQLSDDAVETMLNKKISLSTEDIIQ